MEELQKILDFDTATRNDAYGLYIKETITLEQYHDFIWYQTLYFMNKITPPRNEED